MATKVIKIPSFKRGDTPSIQFVFTAPTPTYSWTGTTVDIAVTNQAAPANNTGAVAIRTAIVPTVNSTTNTATATLTLTAVESGNLIPGTTYHVEPQLKQGSLVNTPVTATFIPEQDYVI